MSYLSIAWRNLWRNKRRTTITAASILFAVFFAIIMRSYQLGFYDHMIKNAIESYSGFLQVQHPDYQSDPSLENTFTCTDSLLGIIENIQGVKAVAPRVETFALASTGEQSKGALILGIDPLKETQLSNPQKQLVRYRVTEKSIELLNLNSEIPDKIKQLLPGIIQNSYINKRGIALDLELDAASDRNIVDAIASVSEFPGNFLNENDSGVLVSDRLSKYLKLNIGDTLILMGQGYHGATAAGIYPIKGIVRIPNPELDNKLVYMSIERAQQFSELENRVTTIAINLTDNSDKNLIVMQDQISSKLDEQNVVIRNWKEFNKVLMQQIESDNQSGKVFLGLLYFIIFFGIFGTVLMMIHERYREFGVLVSIGMRKARLAWIMIIEMFFMGLLGVCTGVLLSTPVIYLLNTYPVRLTGEMAQVMEDMGFEPVMPLAWFDLYILWQGIIVALMVVLASLYPLQKVYKLKEIDALRA